MAQKNTAVVVVSKEWVNSGVHTLVNEGRQSSSTSESHILIASLADASDPRGLWLQGITTHQLRRDGSAVAMRMMVPWHFVYSLGVIEEDEVSFPVGFLATGPG